MKQLFCFILVVFVIFSCKKEEKSIIVTEEAVPQWKPYDENKDLEKTKTLEQSRMHLKLINSKVKDKNDIWESLNTQMAGFTDNDYQSLKPFILDKSIPELQNAIKKGDLSYEKLVKFYIYRIRKFETDNMLSLNAVLSLNPQVINEAKRLDKMDKSTIDMHSIYGMPILLKDNIDVKGMVTTAGAVALKDNKVDVDAFITERLKHQNALILGKTNLSEWAYFLCAGCPVGYSAIGGQTMNPYGRLVFESGGSSSGSGAAVAANFCVAAIGTETSGSILSPSSQNSLVGLKPTVGVLSRSGIVPISSSLDTPGPMTKNVIDNAIVLDAMLGKDQKDKSSVSVNYSAIEALKSPNFEGKKFGIFKEFVDDSLYNQAISEIRKSGGLVFEIEPDQVALPGFLTLLSADMKTDLKVYLNNTDSNKVSVKSVEDIVNFNSKDSLKRIPYGQQLFEGIVQDGTSFEELTDIKKQLEISGRRYFDSFFDKYGLDAILSINNYHAGYAAVAKYPALTVPMGYTASGEPKGLTFISKQFTEDKLLYYGKAFEDLTGYRIAPQDYK